MSASAGIFQETSTIKTLSNGLTVCLERLPYLHSASVGLWVRTGSANEQEAEAGVAHFLEHLFFKGTATRTPHQIMEAIEGRGGHLNAFTSRGYTCLYAKVLDRDVPTAIDVLGDLLQHSTFADLEKERGVVLEEIASIEDSPEELIHDLFSQQHWPKHPLGRPVIGFQQTVAQLDLDRVRKFYDTWYKPENLVFSIAGNIDEDAVLRLIEDRLGGMAPGTVPDPCSAPTFVAGGNHVPREISQAHCALAFPGPALNAPERYSCDMLSTILGGGSTSRLFERIREDEGLAYSIYTFHSFYPMTGLLGVYGAVAPENCEKAMDITYEELRRIREEPVPAEELEMNREQIKGNMLMAMESTFTRMSRLAKCLMYYGRVVPIEEVIENVDAITPDSIQQLANDTFRADRCAVMVLGPTKGYDPKAIAL